MRGPATCDSEVQSYLDSVPDGAALVAGSGTSNENIFTILRTGMIAHAQKRLTKYIHASNTSHLLQRPNVYIYESFSASICDEFLNIHSYVPTGSLSILNLFVAF